MTFQVPPIVTAPPVNSSNGAEDKLDEAQWHCYRFVNDQCPAWPSLLAFRSQVAHTTGILSGRGCRAENTTLDLAFSSNLDR
jgi:hypothetical protein